MVSDVVHDQVLAAGAGERLAHQVELGAAGLVVGRAGLHAQTLGLVTLLLGFGVRLLRGHGGLELRLGADGMALLGLVQAAALLRVLGPIFRPADPVLMWQLPAALLCAAFAAWGARWIPLVARSS